MEQVAFRLFLDPCNTVACVYIRAFETGGEALREIGKWLTYYNTKRPHSRHGMRKYNHIAYSMTSGGKRLPLKRADSCAWSC